MGGASCTTPALSAFALDGDKPVAAPPLELAIRGLIRKDGKRMQPVQIFVQNPGAGTAVVTTLDALVVALGSRSPLNFSNELPDLQQGVHVNLFNNAWGTNYPQWAGGD